MSCSYQISPNNKNFPGGKLVGIVANMDNCADIETFMIGVYANVVPCLCTYPNEVTRGFQVAQIATTLRNGDGRGYDHTYNYFDPGNFFSLSAILYSGDPYLQEQARLVIERSGAFIKMQLVSFLTTSKALNRRILRSRAKHKLDQTRFGLKPPCNMR
jgi:hypothetical protein